MFRKLDDFIFVKNYLPEDLCKKIIETIDNRSWSKHKWHNSIDNSFNSEKEKELDVQGTDQELQNVLTPYIIQAVNDYTQAKFFDSEKTKNLVTAFSPVRFNKYANNATMRTHYDHIQSIFDGQRRGIPVLSILGILNHDYKGGDFLFYDEYKIELKAGDIMIFPSVFLYPHKVCEVTEGVRYSYISWAF